MKLWDKIVKWCTEQPEEQKKHRVIYTDKCPVETFLAWKNIDAVMVGEPIRSVIKSVKANPKDWKLKSESLGGLNIPNYRGSSYYVGVVIHKPTGREFKYRASVPCAGETNLGTVKIEGLEFTLNAWEQRALISLFESDRSKAKDRLVRLRNSRQERKRKAKEQVEIDARNKLKLELGI